MKGIKIQYTTDRESWSDIQFEDQESKEFVITWDALAEIIRQNASFADDERLDNIEEVRIIR